LLSRALVFVFTFLGIFALLMANMPGELVVQTFNPSYNRSDEEVKEKFKVADLTMYSNAVSGNISYGSSKQYDFGLPSGQKLEVWFSQESVATASGYVTFKAFELRHLMHEILGWWYDYHRLDWTIENTGRKVYDWVLKGDLEEAWNSEVNASVFTAHCDHITTSVLIMPYNSSWTIEESWDNGYLGYVLSYEVDWNATGVSAWTITAQLLTFQVPDLGIPGVGGTIMSYLIAIPVWSLIAYLVYKLVAGLIPFVSGGGGD